MAQNGQIRMAGFAKHIPLMKTIAHALEIYIQMVDILQIKHVAIVGVGLEIIMLGNSFFKHLFVSNNFEIIDLILNCE